MLLEHRIASFQVMNKLQKIIGTGNGNRNLKLVLTMVVATCSSGTYGEGGVPKFTWMGF